MKIFFAFILLFAIACSSIFGLMNSDNESFIQGKWQVENEKVANNSLKWEFKNGKFRQIGSQPRSLEGRYKVIEDHDDILRLELYNQMGTSGKKSAKLEIVVDKKNERLLIGGKGGDYKTLKKSV